MKRELVILSVLYDLAITIGKESRVEPLVTHFLQKLMFHTGYAAGIYLSRLHRHQDRLDYRIETIIGDSSIGERGEVLSLPAAFATHALIDPDLDDFAARLSRYPHALWLPAADEGAVLLLTQERQPSDMPLATMFDPLMRNFAHALELCRFNESHLAELEEKIREATQHINLEKERYSKLLLSMPDAVIITDRDGAIEMINRSTELLFGYSAYELLGQPVEILIPEEYRKGHTALVGNYMQDPEARMMASMRRLTARKKSGETFPASISLNPVMIKDKQQVIASVRDMSEYEALMSKFQQAQKMEALGTLVGGISHDFNNLISTIVANVYLAKETLTDNEAALEQLTSIEEQAMGAAEMIQQLLAFARKDRVDMQPLSLSSLLRDAMKFYRSAIPSLIDLSLNIPQEEMLVKGNSTQLQQIVLNLLNNARDAVMESATREIGIDLKEVDHSETDRRRHSRFTVDRYACISVSDTGHGIPKAILQQIFDPFFTTKPLKQGAGLGLAMVYGTVESHNGIIDVESREGEGTTFRLYFPLIEPGQATEG